MIGGGHNAATRRRPPTPVYDVTVKTKGISTGITHRTLVSAKTLISDDFSEDLGAWHTISGTMWLDNGQLRPNLFFIDSGYHKTQLLSDNMRAKVTIGSLGDGKCRLHICASPTFSTWYALEINRSSIFGTFFNVLSGRGPTEALVLDSDVVSPFNSGSECEIWYDEDSGMVRTYLDGVEKQAVPVLRNDIRHGRGYRYAGVTLGVEYFLLPGCSFNDFSAWDV